MAERPKAGPVPPVVLIGFMGAGKTTVGRELDGEAIDSDREIERRAGKSIPEIFAEGGESGFRRFEEEVVLDLISRAAERSATGSGIGAVISLGGGAILSPAVREALAGCVTVWLDIDLESAWRRSGSGEGDRPLARDRAAFDALYHERRQIYLDLADAILPATGLADSDTARRSVEAGRIRRSLLILSRLPKGTRLLWAKSSGGSYPVYVGPGLISEPNGFNLGSTAENGSGHAPWPESGNRFLVTDHNLQELLGRSLGAGPDTDRRLHAIPPGETAKTLANVEAVILDMVEAGCSRADHVVAVGGGVVGDLAGFCASVYQRGIPVVQVPTTVVAQVDSAYGGKTGVDLPGAKNYVGAYHQPAAVIADTKLLESLPAEELAAGFVEVLKTGLLAGGRLWDAVVGVEPHSPQSISRHPFLVFDCARFKCDVVAADERDGGLRQILNLGHTVGHAIEAATGYRAYRHGEAVGLGLLAALRLSDAPELREQVAEILTAWDLPVTIGSSGPDAEQIAALIKRDKKRLQGETPFVLLGRPGQPRYGQQVDAERVLDSIRELFN